GEELTIPTSGEVSTKAEVKTETKQETAATEQATQQYTYVAPVETVEPVVATPAAPAASTSDAKEWIAQRESSRSYTATNGRYIGRYQLDSSYLNGDYSAANQERVADEYVSSRYGSWDAAKAFWLSNGWY
ncbi:peptidase M23, partial [Vibrio parahaemolyticus]|nr:peptidase M23 [Vibrio parahaemolyticus]